jgi:hypothetical protein
MHYMSFEEAQVLPFDSEHQPSLKATTLRIDTATKRRETLARAKRGAARVATSLSHNITELNNQIVFNILYSTLLMRHESVALLIATPA